MQHHDIGVTKILGDNKTKPDEFACKQTGYYTPQPTSPAP